MSLGDVVRTFRFIVSHPVNRGRRMRALGRYVRWQIGSRLVPGPVAVPFVAGSRLLVSPGMTGATGIVYGQLSEYEEMAFIIHLLRPDDLFVDVGANVGAYTILAATLGASVIAMEPVEETVAALRENVRLNDLVDRVEVRATAAGRGHSRARMITHLGTRNRVVGPDESAPNGAEVEVEPLSSVLGERHVTVLKVDVEGWEPEVLTGADPLLEVGQVAAVVIETRSRVGEDRTDEVDGFLRERGYTSVTYDPRGRELVVGSSGGRNRIYVRDRRWADERLRSTPNPRLAFDPTAG